MTDNDNQAFQVKGDKVAFWIPTLGYSVDTTIHSANYNNQAMVIQYTHTAHYYNDGGRYGNSRKRSSFKTKCGRKI